MSSSMSVICSCVHCRRDLCFNDRLIVFQIERIRLVRGPLKFPSTTNALLLGLLGLQPFHTDRPSPEFVAHEYGVKRGY
jgi:hypothetical protein